VINVYSLLNILLKHFICYKLLQAYIAQMCF